MVTPHDIHSVTFNKGFRGYRTEDVDTFLDKAAEQVDSDAKKLEELEARNAELKEKLYLLARKVEDYRADEDNLKSALINAQRMGENVIREAKQKADEVVRKANIRADDIVRMATDRANEEQKEYERVRIEVTQFKANILDVYRKHLESLSTLPEYTKPDAQSADENAAQSEAAEAAPVQEKPEKPEEKTPAPAAEPAAASQPEAVKPATEEEAPAEPANSSSFWDSDETGFSSEAAPVAVPKSASALHGIRFTD